MTGTETARYLVGVQDDWHAIDAATTVLSCDLHDWAVCGAVVRRAKDDYQPYDPHGYPVLYDRCPACFWTVAAQARTLDEALASLSGDPLAHAVAAAVLAATDGEDDPDYLEPAVQLLTAVTRHAAVNLVAEGCAEADCEHVEQGGKPGECPGRAACQACSLQAGSWAGEWEGQYRTECTIPAPCAVLLALAAHFGVTP